MIKGNTPADVIQGFIKAVHDSLIEPLKRNQGKLALQRELRESKRFQDAENKIKEYGDAYNKFKDSYTMRDTVLDVLRKFHAVRVATRMTNFLDKKDEMALNESEELKQAIAPYLSLLSPAEEITKMQTTLMNQGKIKKMALPYDEISSTINHTTALARQMPGILMGGICDNSENLDQVA